MSSGWIKGMLLMGTLLILAVPVWSQRGPGWGMQGHNGDGRCLALLNSVPMQSLSSEEVTGLNYMREEEKLARDVYTRLYAKWGIQRFDNISWSEQRHFAALGALLVRYGLADPAADHAAGVFADSRLQTLYGDLIAKGEVSPAGAWRVGATIEDLDIRNLEKALSSTDNDDFKIIYGHLQEGSRHHLQAFVGHLTALGETYSAQYIDAATLAEILASSHGAGMGRGGCGHGRTGAGRSDGSCPFGHTPGANPGMGYRGYR